MKDDTSSKKPRVLVVCTHNSARSQMAEAILRHRYGDRLEALSAGTEPGSVHPLAMQVMAEAGMPLDGQRSKSVAEVLQTGPVDLVLTVCDSARETCPFVPSRRGTIHRAFEDPSAALEAERLAAFRRVRDELDRWLAAIAGNL
ncbi:MAG TPA: arsenate reductase ArsC [Thermoanaerobaculia bacterium]|nr:arsenate reductase ArsC [Thermoanaerobaculia bacterium]